jgi:hypothetical protein
MRGRPHADTIRRSSAAPSREGVALLLASPSGSGTLRAAHVARIGDVFSLPLHDIRKISIYFASLSQITWVAGTIIAMVNS